MPTVDLPADPSAAGIARRFLRENLGPLGLPGELIADAELLVSELVTNAVVHAQSGSRVGVDWSATHLRISVFDSSNDAPELRDCGTDSVTGRGLYLVDRIAERWGVDYEGAGKRVWFELDVRPREALRRSRTSR